MESLKTYTYCRKAQYHETDQMGIIHHSNYVKWMEEARIGYMNQMGFSYKKVEELGVISPVVEISVAYKKQVFFDDELQVRVSIKKYKNWHKNTAFIPCCTNIIYYDIKNVLLLF